MHKQLITKNLDIVVEHMQYKQPSEFSETHREETRSQNPADRIKLTTSLTGFQLNITTQNQELTTTIHILRGKEGEPLTLTNNRMSLARHRERKVRSQISTDRTKNSSGLTGFQISIITQNWRPTPSIHIHVLRDKEGDPRTLTNNRTS